MLFFKLSKKDLKMNNERVEGSFNSDHKNLIRQQWNQPLIKHLSKKLGNKLIYVGLPSSKAEDVIQWLDYVKTVIAFQCREYGKPSAPEQSRAEIEKLEELLRELERERKIEDFIVYDGYFEEVILRGNDNSPYRIEYSQNSFVTLYNLDFCNQITSPMEYLDAEGNVKTVYKFNAIQKLLKIQDSLANVSDKFIFFLTVHCSYHGKELHNFVNEPPDQTIKGYLDKYKDLKGDDKNARIVRLFVIHQIRQYFAGHNFNANILPVVKYAGLDGTPLLHFVVIGTKPEPSATGIEVFQTLEEVIDLKFATIEAESFINQVSEVDEKDIKNLNIIDLFVNSRSYQKLWG